MVARKGRARRFREARELKQGFDDGLFSDEGRTLADLEDENESDSESDTDKESSWDPDEPAGSAWDEEDDPLYDPRDAPRES